MPTTPPWLQIMRDVTGTKETPGEGDNPVILSWPAFIGQTFPDMQAYCSQYKHDATAWCGLAVAYCMARVGIRPVFGPTDTDRFLWADAWRQFGQTVSTPQLGDVLVFRWSNGSHHVTMYEGTEGSTYLCRGGNQSDAVNVAKYPIADCTGIQRPQAIAAPPIADDTPSDDVPPPVVLTVASALARMRQFMLTEGGVNAEIEEFKKEIIADLEAVIAKIKAFSITAAAPSGVEKPAVPVVPIKKFTDIYSTCFGGSADPQHSAYDGHLITDQELGCSLPGTYKGFVVIEFLDTGKTVTVPNLDKGPWNMRDQYWVTNTRPLAESQYANKTLAQNGSIPSNPAGIDLTPATVIAGGGASNLKATSTWSGHVNWWLPPGNVPITKEPMMNPITTSPVTSIFGGGAMLTAIWQLIQGLGTKDPATIGTGIMGLFAGLAGLFAQDGHKK